MKDWLWIKLRLFNDHRVEMIIVFLFNIGFWLKKMKYFNSKDDQNPQSGKV